MLSHNSLMWCIHKYSFNCLYETALTLSEANNGAAPLPRAVAEYFAQFDITLCQMYGMSETTGTACMNSPSE